MQKYSGLRSHHCYGGTNQIENKYGTTREKMSTSMNEGANIYCKAVTTQAFTVVCLLIELVTEIATPNGYIEAYISII